VGARFADWKIWPNTLKAHQMIQFCRDQQNMSTDLVNKALFKAEYEEGKNLSDVQTLVELAHDLGVVDLELLHDYLMKDEGRSAVQAEIRSGTSQYRIRGVPFFVVRGRDPTQRPYTFSGAQDADTIVELFREVAADDGDDEEEEE
jgi:predicted DsbA family dithiol-disulfide isomerase